MKLNELRVLKEQETSAGDVSGAPEGGVTDAGDIATFPYPFFWSPIPSTPKLFAPNIHVIPSNSFVGKTRKKKRKRAKYREVLDYTPWDGEHNDDAVMMDLLLHAMTKKLAAYHFNFEVKDGSFLMIAPSGNKYICKVEESFVYMAPQSAKVKMNPEIGFSSDHPTLIAYYKPQGHSTNRVWKIAEMAWWPILKTEVLSEIAPFVEHTPLDPKDKKKIEERFIVIPKDKYLGHYDHLGEYRKKYDKKEELQESAKGLDYYKPLNNWSAKFSHVPRSFFFDALKKVKKNENEAKQHGSNIVWGNELRFRHSPNGIGIVEWWSEEDKRWYAHHAVPIVPEELAPMFLEELLSVIQSWKKPGKSSRDIDSPEFVWKAWEMNTGDPNYNSGIAYYRDGEFGIDYTISGMGRGTSDAQTMDAPYTRYRFFEGDGYMRIMVEQVFRSGQTQTIGPSDLDAYFHLSKPDGEILNFLQRFTFSS